jgi:hypothetical protein
VNKDYQFDIIKDGHCLYRIAIVNEVDNYTKSIICDTDYEIAQSLNMETVKYQHYLEENFSGFKLENYSMTYFENRHNTQQAIEWIKSKMICNKLL